MKRNFLLLLGVLTLAVVLSLTCFGHARAAHEYLEADYQTVFCASHGGVMELLLPSGNRVDCVFTDADGVRVSLEADFAKGKHHEALGQACEYSEETGFIPGVLLILERPEDRKYLDQLERTARYWKIPLRVWTMAPDDLRKLSWKRGGGGRE
jgi:hypothetical protein